MDLIALRRASLVAMGACACACRGGNATQFPGGELSPVPSTAPSRLVREMAAPPNDVAPPGSVPHCANPMFDPHDNTALTLVASGAVGGILQGDYAVPDGRYGVPKGARLRVDCSNGRVIAVVTGGSPPVPNDR